MTGDDRRQHRRIDARVKVTFRSLEALAQEYTQNISGGGLFIKTDKLLDPNAEVYLEMTFPNQLGTFQVWSKVVRLMSLSHPSESGKQLYGVGLRFINPSETMIKLIEEALGNQKK